MGKQESVLGCDNMELSCDAHAALVAAPDMPMMQATSNIALVTKPLGSRAVSCSDRYTS